MTELIWDGKYKDGRKVAPVRIALPFQTIETINQSATDRKKDLASMLASGAPNTEWKNRLIWGNKKYVLPSLLADYAGKVNLIYTDPPFDTGANFSFKASIPKHPDSETDENTEFIKQPNMLEQKAYRDTWGKGLDSYLQWFYDTIIFLRELLADNGSIYVHLDYHIAHYAKLVLDEIFGIINFRNEIIVNRTRKNFIETSTIKSFNIGIDSIYIYSKTENHRILPAYKEVKREDRWHSFDAPNWSGNRPNLMYELFGKMPPKGCCWRWTKRKS